MMTRCIRPRAGATWPLALPLIPYRRRNLAMKRSRLAQAGTVIAVSSAIERDLRERAPELAATPIERIPNPVDCSAITAQAGAGRAPLATPYAVYVGKLALNKGATKLVAAAARARLPWPLVVVGDGPSRVEVERAAREAGVTARFTGWLPRDEALVWLRHASLVVFPSHGPESLSRVLLEASVLARPIAAMDTGGTRDIVLNGSTGLLSANVEELGDHVARLVSHPDEAARLGEAAARHVRATFDAPRVLDQIEALYRRLLAGPAISRGSRGA
jgi:glycosyltransferase involved in cell wall biosynthesis